MVLNLDIKHQMKPWSADTPRIGQTDDSGLAARNESNPPRQASWPSWRTSQAMDRAENHDKYLLVSFLISSILHGF